MSWNHQGVFEIGEKVRYWSGTHAKWVDASCCFLSTFAASHCFTLLLPEVEAHVQRINRGPDGDLISYDLTAKAQAQHQGLQHSTCPGSFRASSLQADISRVKDASTAEDAFLSQEIEDCVGACILGRFKSIGFWFVLFYM